MTAQEQLNEINIQGEREKSEDPVSTGDVVEVEKDYPSSSVADQLKDVPGLMWMRSGGEGRRISLSIRGVSNQQVQVQWEGVPLNTALGGGTDLSQVPTWGDEVIEVYRGGNSVLGSSALGGGIHIKKKRIENKEHVLIGLRGGGFGSLGGRLRIQDEIDGWGLQTGVEGTHRQGDFTFIDHNGNQRKRLHNGSLDWSVTGTVQSPEIQGHSFQFNTWLQESNREMPGVEQFPTLDAYLDQDRWVNSFAWNFPETSLLSSQVRWWYHQRQSHYTSSSSLMGSDVDNRLRSRATGGQGDTRWLISDWVTAVARLDGSIERANVSLKGTLTENKQAEQRAILGTTQAVEFSLWNEKVLLIPALRTDWTSDQSLVVLPKAGALFSPVEWAIFSVNGSRAYRPPSFEELYFDQGSTKGNPELNPEKAWSLDTQIKLGNSDYWIRGTVYALWIDNLILFLPTSAFLIQATDSKSAQSFGYEGEAHLTLAKYVNLRGGYTYTETQFEDTGEALPAKSPHSAFGRLSWKQSFSTLSGDIRWRSAFPLDRFGQLKEEGRFMLDASWKAQFSDEIYILLEGFNLLDKQDAVDAMLQPLPGRSFFATTSIRF